MIPALPWLSTILGDYDGVVLLEESREEVTHTRAFDLLPPLQRGLLVVYRLTGQGEDPDLCYLAQHVFLVAAQRQNLATLRGVLHHLWEAKEKRKEKKMKK